MKCKKCGKEMKIIGVDEDGQIYFDCKDCAFVRALGVNHLDYGDMRESILWIVEEIAKMYDEIPEEIGEHIVYMFKIKFDIYFRCLTMLVDRFGKEFLSRLNCEEKSFIYHSRKNDRV